MKSLGIGAQVWSIRSLISAFRHWVFRQALSSRVPPETGFTAKTEESAPHFELLACEREWLRSELRRNPPWQAGHHALGAISLRLNDVASAYASAHALLALEPSDNAARLLLARCFVRRGDPDAACAILKLLEPFSPNSRFGQECTKEMAAALLLRGDRARVVELLRTLPLEALDAESKAVLHYAARIE